MKRVSLVVLLMIFVLYSCEKEKAVSVNDLPATSNSYISTHFSEQEVLQIVKENDDLTVSYQVYLNNGVKLEFNKSGEIVEIEGNTKLPDSVIPSQLLAYVTTHYPQEFIKGWELEATKQDIELSNGQTLEFDRNGTFLRIDD